MSKVAIFIDGSYLDHVQRYELKCGKIDLMALANLVTRTIHPDADTLRSYYYHCLPYQSDPPTTDESERFAGMQRFLDTVDRFPRFMVQLGRLARRGPDKDGKFRFEQKMVDTLLSIDLVRLSTKGQITYAAIIAGDSDFVPAVKIAKEEGISVWLFHGKRPHNLLWNTADERVELTFDFVKSVLLEP
jgi:uncharacterized LabA/DUF88 family protein